MCPTTGLNTTFGSGMARRWNVALISQSGAICTALLDWTAREQVGLSALISTGSMLDVGWGALIAYLGSDPSTRSIVIYMESVGDTRSFLSAAREVALTKPILVINAGRTEPAAKSGGISHRLLGGKRCSSGCGFSPRRHIAHERAFGCLPNDRGSCAAAAAFGAAPDDRDKRRWAGCW